MDHKNEMEKYGLDILDNEDLKVYFSIIKQDIKYRYYYNYYTKEKRKEKTDNIMRDKRKTKQLADDIKINNFFDTKQEVLNIDIIMRNKTKPQSIINHIK